MKRRYLILPICLCMFFMGSVIESNAQDNVLESLQQSFRSVAKKVYPSVVAITTVQVERKKGGIYYVPQNDPFFDGFFGDFYGRKNYGYGYRMPDREFKKVGIGSGVIVDPRGYVLTNYHVVEKALNNMVTVRLSDGRELDAKVSGSDPRYDIALLKIQNGDSNFPAAVLGDSNAIDVGDWAIAIGNPYGFAFDDAHPTMTVGVVSALNRSLPGWIGMKRTYTNLIQTDAAINMGNSGGPLVNIKGEVIGINVAIVSTTGGSQGLGFAIPSNLCQDIITEVVEGKEVLYSWLGVSVQNMNRQLADYFGFPGDGGVLVIKSIPNSPARVGGLRDGDIITMFNNTPIRKVDDLLNAVNRSRVGEKVEITVFRNEVEMIQDVIMGSRPREIEASQSKDALFWRGIKIDNITFEHARELGIPNLKGVVITDVETGSPADRAGLSVGEIIVSINNTPVNNLDDYYSVIYSLTDTALVKTLRGFFVVEEN